MSVQQVAKAARRVATNIREVGQKAGVDADSIQGRDLEMQALTWEQFALQLESGGTLDEEE